MRYPLIATDIIIEYSDGRKGGVVLIKRKNPPHGLAIPGGILEYGLTLKENAIKEAKEETNLDVLIENNVLCINDNPDRDPRGHIISLAYIGKGAGRLEAGSDALSAELYNITEIKDLIKKNLLVFDHPEILMKYLTLKEQDKND